jgi:hypothetical protein
MKYKYKHRAYPMKLFIDAETPEKAKTFLLRVVKSYELWSEV